MSIATSLAPDPGNAIQACPDWQSAVHSLLNYLIQENACFSSGEVAAALRTFRPDLVFSVLSVGEFLRDMFYTDMLPSYEDNMGDEVYPVQVSRITQGIGRTKAGIMVFVYGIDRDTADGHDFEVDIPLPGNQATLNPDTGMPQAYPTPDGHIEVMAPTTLSSENAGLPMAYVANDTRCYLPRKVVDAYFHIIGQTVQRGTKAYVYINEEGDAVVTADPTPGAHEYALWATTGRVAFYHPDTPFREGTNYDVHVSQFGVIVKL